MKSKQQPLPPNPKTEAEWRVWLAHDMDHAVKYLLAAGGISPLFVLHTSDGEMILFKASWQDPQSKDATLMMIRLVAVVYDAVAISLSLEGWWRSVVRQPGESSLEHHTRAYAVAPSEAEDRIEVVIVTLTYRDDAGERHPLGDAVEIVRDSDGKPTGVKPVFPTDEGKPGIEGTLVDLLPERAAPPHIREAGRRFLADLGVVVERMERPS